MKKRTKKIMTVVPREKATEITKRKQARFAQTGFSFLTRFPCFFIPRWNTSQYIIFQRTPLEITRG